MSFNFEKKRFVKTSLDEKLYQMLKNIWDDEHFIYGIIQDLKTPEQTHKMIDILKEGEIDTDQLILIAMDIRNGEV